MTVTITLQRDKCIGCGYCEAFAPEYFKMSQTDGKTKLQGSEDKKGFFTLRTGDPLALESCGSAAQNCPVKIIRVTPAKK